MRLNKNAQQRVAKAEANGLCAACMEPILEGEPEYRGCHERCYKATKRAIDRGEFTDEQRVSEGKWLAKKPPGRKPTNPVTVEARR